MKHIVTNLEAQNESVMVTNSILGNHFFEVDFKESSFGESSLAKIDAQS